MDETFGAKFKRKSLENPFVFPGLGLSIYAWYQMTKTFRRNDQREFQHYKRMRLVFSFGTVMAIALGSAYQNQEKFKSDFDRIKNDILLIWK